VNVLLAAVGSVLLLPAACTRLFWLAPTRAGWLFYYPNVLIDYLVKRAHLSRWVVGVVPAAVGLVAVGCSGPHGPVVALATAVALLLLELDRRRREGVTLTTNYTVADPRRGAGEGGTPGVPGPSVLPTLTVTLRGPFVGRRPRYDLGDLVRGRVCDLVVIVANHTTVRCQNPISVIACAPEGSGLRLTAPSGGREAEVPALKSGAVATVVFRVEATEESRAGVVTLVVDQGGAQTVLHVGYRAVRAVAGAAVVSASVTRYPGACRSAFAWRGDMDWYDQVSFQSIEGLQKTLGLAARYCFPQTLFLSSRLSLSAGEAAAYFRHFNLDRGQEEVPAFVEWMKQNVEIRERFGYPFCFEKPLALELGNHMHLHYGTDAAAAPENGWRFAAGIGSGRYDWSPQGAGSFEEQRANALACRKHFEQCFGYTPRSWAMPDSTSDAVTPAAVEAAGCEVLSDSDAAHADNVLFQPPPHHPTGTEAVELTKRYPGDPQNQTHLDMIRYWLHRGYRLRIPVVFMCHQHMRQFDGYACERFTEAVLRDVLSGFNGDLFISTVSGIGVYWRDFFSPVTRRISVSVVQGRFRVENTGANAHEAVPVDVALAGGGQATYLVDVPAGATVELGVDGVVRAGT